MAPARTLTRVVAAAALAGCATHQAGVSSDPTPASGVESELVRIEREFGQALGRRDTAYSNRVLAADFISIGEPANTGKREFITSLASSQGAAPSYELLETHVRQYGAATIVTGLVNYPAYRRQLRFSEVWTKDSGDWRLHVGHYDYLPAASPR